MLYKVPLADPAATSPVALPEVVEGQDGMVWTSDARLAIVSNSQNRVVVFTSSDGWATAQLAGVGPFTIPGTTGAVVGSDIYVVQPHFADQDPPSVERVALRSQPAGRCGDQSSRARTGLPAPGRDSAVEGTRKGAATRFCAQAAGPSARPRRGTALAKDPCSRKETVDGSMSPSPEDAPMEGRSIITIAGAAIAASSASAPPPSAMPPAISRAAGAVGAFEVRVGDCFDDEAFANTEISEIPAVPCSQERDDGLRHLRPLR